MYFDDESVLDNAVGTPQEVLEKALTTGGYGTDAATFTGGRALQPEDLETTLVNVLTKKQEDFKLFNSLERVKSKSNVHQLVRRIGIGDDEFGFVAEGEDVRESEQEIERKFVDVKYVATMGRVTKQAEETNMVESAYNTEKIAATMRVTRMTERGLFHGDSSIIEEQFDGLLKSISDSANNTDREEKKRATVVDLRGYEIGEEVAASDKHILTGEDLFDSIAESVYNKGGDLSKALFPPVIAGQFRNLYNEKLRYSTGDNHLGFERLPNIVTAIGSTIRIQGKDAGADKMYYIKGEVKAKGTPGLRPNKPASVTLTVNNSPVRGESQFGTNDAGDYVYVVHAVNSKGVSAGTAAAAAATVAAGKSVTITITPDENGVAPAGYIITRSAKDGTKVMEMVTIKAKKGEATTYEDLNDELPGTGSVLLLSELTQEAMANHTFLQLMSLSTIPLPRAANMSLPFIVALFGNLEHRAPEFDAMIKNVGVRGGLY